jgi:hypothetical protein
MVPLPYTCPAETNLVSVSIGQVQRVARELHAAAGRLLDEKGIVGACKLTIYQILSPQLFASRADVLTHYLPDEVIAQVFSGWGCHC